MSKRKPRTNTRYKTINSEKKHPILYVTVICQIILEFLQYENSLKVYKWFNCKEPKRPCFDISLLEAETFYMIQWKPFMKSRHNVENWYIQYTGYEITSNILFSLLNASLEHNNFHWQCPNCKNYTKIEYIKEDNRYLFRSFVLQASTWYALYLCKCSIKNLIKISQLQKYTIKKLFVEQSAFIPTRYFIPSNNYITHKAVASGNINILDTLIYKFMGIFRET